jgi:hypothetical protein
VTAAWAAIDAGHQVSGVGGLESFSAAGPAGR